jgi:hypothetical protein
VLPLPTFTPAGSTVTDLLDRADYVSEHEVEGSPPWEHHHPPAKAWNDHLVLRFHSNQQVRLLDVAALLEAGR